MGLTITQRYNKVINDIALRRKGISADSYDELTDANWQVLYKNASGDKEFARVCVLGYFYGTGTDYIEKKY